MIFIKSYKKFECDGSSGSGDISVKNITKKKIKKRKLGNPSEVSDLRFLKKEKIKKLTESNLYYNQTIDNNEFFKLVKLKMTFKKSEIDKLIKNLKNEISIKYGLVPILKFSRFIKGDDYDIDKIYLSLDRKYRSRHNYDRELTIWKIPDYYYLICYETDFKTTYIKCDDIEGAKNIINKFNTLS